MKNLWLPLSLIAAWLGYQWYQKIEAVKKFTADFLNFRNESVSSGQLTFDVTMAIANASTHTITVDRIAGNVLYNGYNIGTFSSPTTGIVINPGSQNILLNIQTPILNAVANLPIFLQGITTGKPQPISFTGFITSAGFQIPIDFTYNIPAIELKVLLQAFHKL